MKIIACWIHLWKTVGGVPNKVNKEYVNFLALSDYISDKLLKYKLTFNPKMCSSHLWSIKAHINPFYLEFRNSKLLPLYVIIFFPPKLYVTHSGHMISSSGLLLARAATFTRVNGTVSCFCNKRLQNWPTVYTNFVTWQASWFINSNS